MSSNENDKVEKLKKLLARASNRINDLTSNINSHKKELDESKKLNESLRHELDKANELKNEYLNLIETLKSEKQSLIESNSKSLNNINISKKEYDSIIEQKVNEAVEKCKKQLNDEHSSKIEQIVKEYEEKLSTNENNYQSQYKSLEEKLIQTEDEFKRYKIKVNKIFKEQESNSEKSSPSPSEDFQIIIKQLKDKLNSSKSNLNKLITEKEELELSYKQKNEQIRNLQIEKDELLEKVNKLKEKKDNMEKQYQININDLKNEIEQLKLKHNDIIDQLKEEYEKKLSDLKETTKEQIFTLNNTLSEYKYDLEQLKEENKELKADIDQYKLNEEKNVNEFEVKSIERLASIQSKHENQIFRQQKEINDLKESLEESERMIQLFQIQEKVLKEEIRKLENNEKLSRMNENNIVLLKNIIIKHLETGEYEHLLPAISELLYLTPEEVNRIKSNEDKRKSNSSKESGSITSGIWKVFSSPSKR